MQLKKIVVWRGFSFFLFPFFFWSIFQSQRLLTLKDCFGFPRTLVKLKSFFPFISIFQGADLKIQDIKIYGQKERETESFEEHSHSFVVITKKLSTALQICIPIRRFICNF